MGDDGDHRLARQRWVRGAAIMTIIAAVAMITSVPAMATALDPGGHPRAATEPSSSSAGDNQADAMSAIAQYDEAFVEEDCDLFMQVTTAALRRGAGITDCDTFAQRAGT